MRPGDAPPTLAGGSRRRVQGLRRVAVMLELAHLFGAVCHYCDADLDLDDATLDHVWPFSLGGGNGLRNLVLACRVCNGRLGDDVVKCLCGRCRRVWLPIVNARLRLDLAGLPLRAAAR